MLEHVRAVETGTAGARTHEIEELRHENALLTEAVKELAVELTLVRGKPKSWA